VTSDADDDARWAEAQALLDGLSTESGERRMRRNRRLRILLIVGLTLVAVVASLVGVLLIGGRRLASAGDVSTSLTIVGLVVMGLGIVVMVVGLVLQFRANRRNGAWRSPLGVLTRRQRKEVLAQVRGRAPVDDRRIPLGRHLAQLLVSQRMLLIGQTGMLLVFAGQWISRPSGWRIGLFVFFGIVLCVAGLFMARDIRRAKRFLDAHPAGVEA
jgi:hypothetical protein